jgi:hypothetical protein
MAEFLAAGGEVGSLLGGIHHVLRQGRQCNLAEKL